ncbi:U3 small nucleolar ribonucleoprotein MPP10-like protein [Sarcoptes scabiei]|uniref:U3 small nucleolar ribonucleoprotein protein MPP10 n=1 Tax=Sarcoptes scabiei TaxID=52283 RepID=A0A132A1A3_SARSC|nr:U3 small nucleolar ribonucleoprotein MPP10-like protein [Sarcoptes scabiei]
MAPEIDQKLLEKFQSNFSNLDNLILHNDDAKRNFQQISKFLYDHGQQCVRELDEQIISKSSNGNRPLQNLFIDGFENEQIWQQLEVFNEIFLYNSGKEYSKLLSSKSLISFGLEMNENLKSNDIKSILKKSKESLNIKSKQTISFNLNSIDKSDEIRKETNHQKENHFDCQHVKVDFFDREEMEQFLNDEDEKAMNYDETKEIDDENEIDYFMHSFSSDSDDEYEEAKYSDFFDPPKSNLLKQSIEVDDPAECDPFEDVDDVDLEYEKNEIDMKLKNLADNDDETNIDLDGKSEYEKSQIKLEKKIKKAEEELLMPHNIRWQLSGETIATIRPSNSLLEEHLQFDHVSRPAPIITDETTNRLEELIKQRIKDKVFDDVERKTKPEKEVFEFRKRIMLESEKSKASLSEIYEQEYLRQKEKEQELNSKQDVFQRMSFENEESETKKQIRKEIRLLFRKLDALSAFHYTPRAPEPEVKIINNLPAITVEEVVPETINEMKLLAPEEVFSTRNNKVLQDKTERTKTDKKRARRLKKKKQKIRGQFVQSKSTKLEIKDKLAKKKSLIDAKEDRKSLSSSTKFFERLQEKNLEQKIDRISDRKKAKQVRTNVAKNLKLS